MATIPPYSPRQQARFQRDAYRAQRDYWRAQRRPSIVRPFILIAIGILALLVETNKISGAAFWDWYTQWWPVLLIVLGALSLGEWWLERNQPYGRRSFGGGIVFLIVLLAITGSGSHHLVHSHGWNWFQSQTGDNDMAWHLFGQEHDADVTLEQAVPAKSVVRVKVPHGDVTIGPSTDGHVHVTAHDVAFASTDTDANKSLERQVPRLTVNGSAVLVETSDIGGGHADLTIDLPADASLDIAAGHGDVIVSGVSNGVKVDAGHGDITLKQIAGPVNAHMSKGDFSAHSVQGAVTIDGRMDDVTLSDIKNSVSLNGDFFGDMHVEQVTGPLQLHSSRTEISIASVPGELTLNKSDVNFKNVTGPVRVVAHSDDVEGSVLHGAAHIESSNGDITLSAVAPLGDIDIRNDNGAVDLTLPAKTGFNLDASATDGQVSTDFDLNATNTSGRASASGQVGTGGPRIAVSAAHGDVHIKKAGSIAATEDAENDGDGDGDSTPTPPKAPKSPMRHLHAPPAVDQPQAVAQ